VKGEEKMGEEPALIRQERLTEASFQALVRAGREKFPSAFPGEDQHFDAPVWDVRAHKDRPLVQTNINLYFTRFGTTDQALPPVYAQVVKSWVILDWHSVATMCIRCDAARLLWEALLLRRRNDPTAFSWHDLCEEDLGHGGFVFVRHRLC